MNDPIQAVLADTADKLDALEPWRKNRVDGGHVAGHVFCQMYESAKELYGTTAIEQLEAALGLRQLQHWDVESVDEAVAAIRRSALSDTTTTERTER